MTLLQSLLEAVRSSARLTGRSPRWSRNRELKLEGLEERCLLSFYEITDLGGYLIRSTAAGINSQGHVAGLTYVSENSNSFHHAFHFDGVTLTDLTPNWLNSQALDINDAGQLVGGSVSRTTFRYTAHLFADGQVYDLGTLGGRTSEARAVSSYGEIVGYSFDEAGQFRAFTIYDGSMFDLGTLGGGNSIANDINGNALVVGGAQTEFEEWHAFLFDWVGHGGMIDLGTLGGSASEATAINDSGTVVGRSTIYGDETEHAFVYVNGEMFDLGTLGGPNSEANAINDSGTIVGRATDAWGANRAFIYQDGVMIDLNTLISQNAGWTLSAATGINDAGQIVGYGFGPAGWHAYLLTPTNAPNGPSNLNLVISLLDVETVEVIATLPIGEQATRGSEGLDFAADRLVDFGRASGSSTGAANMHRTQFGPPASSEAAGELGEPSFALRDFYSRILV